VDNVIKTIDKFVHEKQRYEGGRKIRDLKTIGKFKQSTIGNRNTNNNQNKRLELWTQFSTTKKSQNENFLLKEFENFTHKRLEKFDKEQQSNNGSGEKITELENLIHTSIKYDLSENYTSTTKQLSENVTSGNLNIISTSTEHFSNITDNDPRNLGLELTSDYHQKRGLIQEIPEENGNFVVVAIGVVLCCIFGVVGVGYFLHGPSCNRSATPFSDNSPTFHSAKLAFSSSPEEKINKSASNFGSDSVIEKKPDIKGGDNASRSHKFRENSDNNNYAGLYHYKGTMRQESLIDIEGPEEDDDDLIYECPGLAPHGEMEVTNPFFLEKDFNMNTEPIIEANKVQVSEDMDPIPISTSSNIRHGSIYRNTQPGLQ